MKRHPALDPPEYLEWTPRAELAAEFETKARNRLGAVEAPDLEALLRALYRFRMHDMTLKRWVRRGVISKAWLGTGEEAVTVGAVHALDRERDVVAPMIRNQGALHEMGMPLEQLFAAYMGTSLSPNDGRDGHIGDVARGVIAPISHVGDMVPVITGAALAFKQRREPRVALTWIGDGSTKTAAAHEGFNLAGVLRVPAIFIIQNNQVALGTRTDQHHAGDFRAWGDMYGIACEAVDGNNVLDVYGAVKSCADRARSGEGPFIIVAETFRMGGHATHDEAEARETFRSELFAHWGARDPIAQYEEWLVARGMTRAALAEIEAGVEAEVEAAAERALDARATGMPVGAGERQVGLVGRAAVGG